MAGAGATSILLDIIPVIAGAFLLISFMILRRERKSEEESLRQLIGSFGNRSKEERLDKSENNE